MHGKYIGLFGLKGHGKTSVAKAICGREKGSTFNRGTKISFAEKIRNIIHDVYGIDEATQHVMKTAGTTPPGWLMTMRQAQQHLGTEGFRDICPTTWTDYLFGSFELFAAYETVPPLAVIDDVRFEDEVKAIKARGGFVVIVIKGGLELDNDIHRSESYMREVVQFIRLNRKMPQNHLFDYILWNNNFTLDGLQAQVEAELMPAINQHFNKV